MLDHVKSVEVIMTKAWKGLQLEAVEWLVKRRIADPYLTGVTLSLRYSDEITEDSASTAAFHF